MVKCKLKAGDFINRVIDRVVLLLISAFLIFLNVSGNSSIAILLIGVVLTFAAEYFENDKVCCVIFVAVCLLCIFDKNLIFILPLLIYDICDKKSKLLNFIFLLVPVYFAVSNRMMFQMLLCLLVSLVSVVFRIRTINAERLKSDYIKQRDTYTEVVIEQQYAINTLIKEQDNEVKVAVLDERNRIAREIHDNVGHLLSSSILQLGALITVTKDDETKILLKTLNETLSDGMDSIRRSVHNLRNESIDLKEQLSKIFENFTFCEAILNYDVSKNLQANYKYAVIGIVKECLTNTAKHSNATKIEISVYEHPKLLQIIATDNGTEAPQKAVTNGMGLENIKYRVKSLNGSFNIDNTDGFKIFVTFPINLD